MAAEGGKGRTMTGILRYAFALDGSRGWTMTGIPRYAFALASSPIYPCMDKSPEDSARCCSTGLSDHGSHVDHTSLIIDHRQITGRD